MEKRSASRSAAIVAAHRAVESTRDPEERICYDPFAEEFLPPDFTVIGDVDMSDEMALNIFKDIVPGFHEFFLARTRYIDEFLQRMLENDLKQLVILGAGFDSRAYRFPELANQTKVFEIDHPSTQEVKMKKVEKLFDGSPKHVIFVPVDFLREDLESRLLDSGYDSQVKTLFIWEGVTMYINEKAVNETLQFVTNNQGAGSSIIFDYTSPEVINGTAEEKEAKGWLKIAEKSDEPLLFGLRYNEAGHYLGERGFKNVATISSDYFRDHYFIGENQGKESTPIFSIVHAEVSIDKQA